MKPLTLFETDIAGVYRIKCQQSFDLRGSFVKNFNAPLFESHGINFICRESFYSVSNKNVIRGMHFQVEPFDGYKLVTVVSGHVLDVILDLRRDSQSFGKYLAFDLNASDADAVLIPPNCAHGFLSLEDNCILNYQTGAEYSAKHDFGIRYDSFGFDWPCTNPVISPRDLQHLTLEDFMKSADFAANPESGGNHL